MTTKHTPTPWTVVKTPTNLNPPYLKYRHSIHEPKGQEIAGVHYWNGEPNEANAAFIVRACNSHYELVEALESVLASDPVRNNWKPGQGCIYDMAREALNNATN